MRSLSRHVMQAKSRLASVFFIISGEFNFLPTDLLTKVFWNQSVDVFKRSHANDEGKHSSRSTVQIENEVFGCLTFIKRTPLSSGRGHLKVPEMVISIVAKNSTTQHARHRKCECYPKFFRFLQNVTWRTYLISIVFYFVLFCLYFWAAGIIVINFLVWIFFRS